MSAAEYPTDIITFDGWCRIHHGHGLDPVALVSDWAACHTWHGSPLEFTEVHLRYQPRVKWCGNHGDACDQEGDWHGHWHEIQPTDGPACKFTIVGGAR